MEGKPQEKATIPIRVGTYPRIVDTNFLKTFLNKLIHTRHLATLHRYSN